MKAFVLMGDRKLKFMEFLDPTPGPGEAVIEILASGMCSSDLKMFRAVGGAAALGLVGDGTSLIAGHKPVKRYVAWSDLSTRRPGAKPTSAPKKTLKTLLRHSRFMRPDTAAHRFQFVRHKIRVYPTRTGRLPVSDVGEIRHRQF